MSDTTPATPTRGSSRPVPRRQPNYAARRMLVSTIAITAIVAAVVVGWRIVRGDSDGSTGAAGEWDQIALVDRSTGDVTLVDPDGETVGTIVGATRTVGVQAHGDRLALIGADRMVLAGNDGAAPVDVPYERGNSVTVLPTLDTFHLAIGEPSGGNVVIVDGTTGDTFDVGALAGQSNPLMFAETLRHAIDGSAFAVADAANFQTIVVRPGEPAPTFFPDQPVALDGELIATSQVVGQESDVTLYDAERDSQGVGTVEIPAGGVMVDDGLVVVSVDGTVFRLGKGDQEAERLGVVAVPAGGTVRSVRPILGGQRLVVFGAVFQAVIDLDGATIFTTTFTNPVEAPTPGIDWTCLPVGGTGGYHSLINTETGEQIADLTGLEVTGTSSDGCNAIGVRAGVTELVTADGSVRLGRLRSATLGPDGRTVVWQTTTGGTELVSVDDDLELGDPVDLGEVAPASLAVAFLDD